jgi:hypothetical protein
MASASTTSARSALARAIPRRTRVTWTIGLVLALGFAAVLTPLITAERWLGARVEPGAAAPITVRVAPLTGADAGGGGFIVARGDAPSDAEMRRVQALQDQTPRGPMPYVALFALAAVLAGLFANHARRSSYGRLVRVQVVSLAVIAAVCAAVKVGLLMSTVSMLAVPVALLAIVPTLALDRVVGLATGVLAALAVSLLEPFDVGVAIVLLVQASVAGLVVAERPKLRGRAVVVAGAIVTVCTALTYPLLRYFTTGVLPTAELADPWRSAWVAAAIGPAIATALALPVLPLYQRLVGEITRGKLYQLEDRSHPLLRQIAERAPGTWQHSLAMASMAESAADQIGADARLVRVGAYFHDLGKSLQPKYFIENIEPGETSPHDQLPPEVSCAAIFEHVTEGLVTARRAGLHERVIDFMHMHHGNGVLEYFWSKCREQGNPHGLTIENFRYPGHPPQSRETAILAICDAVEAASRTLKKADAAAIDSLVQRIVYGKLHLGQLDESGLSMGDLRRIADSLRDTIRHANHGRIEYPWQKEAAAAAASGATTAPAAAITPSPITTTSPRLDSLDRPGKPEVVSVAPGARDSSSPSQPVTPVAGSRRSGPQLGPEVYAETADLRRAPSAPPVAVDDVAIVETAPAIAPARAASAAAVTTGGTLIGSKDAPVAAAPAPAPAPVPASKDVPKINDTLVGNQLAGAPPIGAAAPRTSPPTAPPGSRTRTGSIPVARPLGGDPLTTTGDTATTAPRTRTGSSVPPADATAAAPRTRDASAPIAVRAGDASAPVARTLTGDVVAAASRTRTGDASIPVPVRDQSGPVSARTRTGASSPPADAPAGPRTRSSELPITITPRTKTGSGEPRAGSGLASGHVDRSTLPGTGVPLPAPAPASDAMLVIEAGEPPPVARTRAATLSPSPKRERAPTVPPIAGALNLRASGPIPLAPVAPPGLPPLPPGAGAPIPALPVTVAGIAPPTQPPTQPATRKPAAEVIDDDDNDAARTDPAMAPARASDLESTNPRLVMPLPAPAASSPTIRLPDRPPGRQLEREPDHPWASGLAARIDQALGGSSSAGHRVERLDMIDDDSFGAETPVIAPTAAELRALLGVPDATRKQSVDEIERLHAAAYGRDGRDSDPDILAEPPRPFVRTRPHPTTDVTDDDIEAAIDIAPAARRTAIGVAKKKPEE